MPHVNAVYRTAAALTRDRQQAQDLTQGSLLKAFERFETFKRNDNAKAWLMKIMTNTWYDQLRKQRIGREIPLEAENLAAPTDDYEPGRFDEGLLSGFGDQQIIDALKALPKQQRLTLLLVDVEQLAHDQVARILDVSPGTVKSRTSRARAALKTRLSQHAKEMGY